MKILSIPYRTSLLNIKDGKEDLIIYNSCQLIEVLSCPTEIFDREDKFKFYRKVDILKGYVLINTQKINIEVFILNNNRFCK